MPLYIKYIELILFQYVVVHILSEMGIEIYDSKT